MAFVQLNSELVEKERIEVSFVPLMVGVAGY